ncbi:DUF6308 family protein [Streptomyces sp. NPDC056304]|uniref:DUF6308 family protein n=1 Tax=Streptomyces sp. NPDC056304 TaxID=3345778 RepID=UPI0035E2EF64
MPTAEPLAPFVERLRALVADAQAIVDLRRYFGIDLPPGAMPFTGSRFEHLAGGGDRPEAADTITATDLIAVQTLSVTVPVPVALDLLEGRLGPRLTDLLRAIPADVDMTYVDATDLAPNSPAQQAWDLLCDQHGVNWVTAGKLLARKRPRLLPVYDRVVRCAVGRPASFWCSMHAGLRADDHALHRELVTSRQAAGLPESVSALRICDVVVWMRHRTDHQETNCALQ